MNVLLQKEDKES